MGLKKKTSFCVKKKSINIRDPELCILCNKDSDDQYLGQLFKSEIKVHENCLFFSPLLHQEIDPCRKRSGFVIGFNVNKIKQESTRIRNLRCSVCRGWSAGIGCCLSTCRRSFHLICAIGGHGQNAVGMFTGGFELYCAEHSPRQKNIEKLLTSLDGNVPECTICLSLVTDPGYDETPSGSSEFPADITTVRRALDQLNVIHGGCCPRCWAHRPCLRRYGLSAGLHHTKCPNCGDKETFINTIQSFGIWIPDRDASWELEPGAFQEMYEPAGDIESTDTTIIAESDQPIDEEESNVNSTPANPVKCPTRTVSVRRSGRNDLSNSTLSYFPPKRTNKRKQAVDDILPEDLASLPICTVRLEHTPVSSVTIAEEDDDDDCVMFIDEDQVLSNKKSAFGGSVKNDVIACSASVCDIELTAESLLDDAAINRFDVIDFSDLCSSHILPSSILSPQKIKNLKSPKKVVNYHPKKKSSMSRMPGLDDVLINSSIFSNKSKKSQNKLAKSSKKKSVTDSSHLSNDLSLQVSHSKVSKILSPSESSKSGSSRENHLTKHNKSKNDTSVVITIGSSCTENHFSPQKKISRACKKKPSPSTDIRTFLISNNTTRSVKEDKFNEDSANPKALNNITISSKEKVKSEITTVPQNMYNNNSPANRIEMTSAVEKPEVASAPPKRTTSLEDNELSGKPTSKIRRLSLKSRQTSKLSYDECCMCHRKFLAFHSLNNGLIKVAPRVLQDHNQNHAVANQSPSSTIAAPVRETILRPGSEFRCCQCA